MFAITSLLAVVVVALLVTRVATVILGFRPGSVGSPWLRILELVAGMLALLYASRNAWVDRQLTRGIGYLLRRFSDLPTQDRSALLGLADNTAISELAIEPDDWLAERDLGDLALRDEGMVVLAVQRAEGRWLTAPGGTTTLHPGDTLIVYGPDSELAELAELDEQRTGPAGDRAHAEAVARYEQLRIAETLTDRPRPAPSPCSSIQPGSITRRTPSSNEPARPKPRLSINSRFDHTHNTSHQ